MSQKPKKFNQSRSHSAVRTESKRSASLVATSRKPIPSAKPSESRILNITDDSENYGMFFEVCRVFEKSLEMLNPTGNADLVCLELRKIQCLIKKKISEAGESSSAEDSCGSSLSIANVFSSECSDFQVDSDPAFKAFMTEVNCPFCSAILKDKISLVKHLDKGCRSGLNDEVKKEQNFPYATFQIMPNNTFKCNVCYEALQRNLRNFYVHTQSSSHVRGLAKAAKTKKHENCLFCVSCKVLVFNNYTQIKGHIVQEAHKKRCAAKKTSKYFLLKGIACVYNENKKFKCLKCPPGNAVHTTPRSILDHFEQTTHKRLKNAFFEPLIYCEVCAEDIQTFQVITHFTSTTHAAQEKKLKDSCFETCLFCDFFAESLMQLSAHMDSCPRITEIREKISREGELSGQDSKDGEPKNETALKESPAKGPCITVKNCTEIPELFKYFRKFGEIITIASQNDDSVVIEFREKSAVDDVLLLRNLMVVGGKKLDVTIDSRSDQPVEKTTETESENEDSDGSYKNEEKTLADNAANMIHNDQLDDLFGRVSNSLVNNTYKLSSADKEKIKKDCIQTLKIQNCHLVGFSKCELSLPSESVSLYCSTDDQLCKNIVDFSYLPHLEIFFNSLLKASYKKFCDSELWKAAKVKTTQVPNGYIECVHKATGRKCTITFSKSAHRLTAMLRECMKKSKLVQPFCLIIRFWLSVHDLKIRNCEFALISLLVFFLVNANVATLPTEKFQLSGVLSLLAEKVKGSSVEESPGPIANVKLLFHKFLRFIHTFDFDKFAICLPLELPVPKADLDRTLKTQSGLILKECSMCILDPVVCVNLADNIDHDDKKAFLDIVGRTVKHYKIQ